MYCQKIRDEREQELRSVLRANNLVLRVQEGLEVVEGTGWCKVHFEGQ